MAEAQPSEAALVVWRPQSWPQRELIACPVFEVFYGGSRGSLKTDGVLGDWIKHSSEHGENAQGLMVRRTREELSHTMERARQIYTPLGFRFSGHTVRSPNGSLLTFAYLDRDQDAENYQGWSLTRVYVEEIGNFPREGPILKLMATLRSASGVPVGFRATGNPGGPGHQWVKQRYIDPNPKGWEVQTYEYENPFTGRTVTRDRVFIPGRITDHNLLGDEYIAQLQMQASPELVRAWLLGDWDAIEGAFFAEWDQRKHVVEPFEIPADWLRFRSMDWGFAAPFSVGWWAVAGDNHEVRSTHDGVEAGSGQGVRAVRNAQCDPGRFCIPRGALVRYREWYGASGPQKGIRLTAEEVAAGILEREGDEKIAYGVLDPSAFAQDGGPSIAERMLKQGLVWRRADNKRVAYQGAMGGWDQMRARLRGVDGLPMLYVFDTCRDFIRTVPVLQHDPDRPEDLDTDAEDHAADEARYACMSRPWIPKAPEPPKPADTFYATPSGTIKSTLSISELIKRQGKRA